MIVLVNLKEGVNPEVSTPVASQIVYLPIYLIKHLPEESLQPCPPMVGEVAGESSGFFNEHAHVL